MPARVLFFVSLPGCEACRVSTPPVARAAKAAGVPVEKVNLSVVHNQRLDADVQVTPTFYLVEDQGGARGRILARRAGTVSDSREFENWLRSV